MTTTIGTCYFVSKSAAVRYYAGYGFSESDVEAKMRDNEIAVGAPPLRLGETLCLLDEGRRYGICTA